MRSSAVTICQAFGDARHLMQSARRPQGKETVRHVSFVELANVPKAPVDVTVFNQAADNQAVVYIGDAPHSALTLMLTNESDRPLNLKGAQSVPPDMNDAGDTAAVYLDFGNLLDAKTLAELTVSAGPEWRAVFLPDVKLWGLCPLSDTALTINGALSIEIGKVLVSRNPGSAALDVYLANFDQRGPQFREIRLVVQNPPGDKVRANINAYLDNEVMLITPLNCPPIENTFVLDLVNDQGTPLESAPDSVLYLSFVYGTEPGYGALMPIDSALPSLAVTQPGGDGWDPHQDTTGRTPCWRLRPTGKVMLGRGLADTAVFEISGIIVPHNFVAGPTLLFIQWANLPGYRDGHTIVILQKRMPKPSVTLQAVHHVVDYGAKPILTWQTVAAPYLQLSYFVYGKGTVFLPAADGALLPFQASATTGDKRGFVVPDPIYQDTSYNLSAYDEAPPLGQQPSAVPIAGSDCPVTVQHPLPNITRFGITPALWPPEFNSTAIKLEWTVDWIETRAQHSLTLHGPDQTQNLSVDQTGSIVVNGRASQKWSLEATGSDGRAVTATVELKPQALADYLYRRPRRYRGAGTGGGALVVRIAIEVQLYEVGRNIISVTMEFAGTTRNLVTQNFAATIDGNVLIIPNIGDLEITPNALVVKGALVPAGAFAVTTIIPNILYEENR
jgi:hypothetical protein